MTKEEGTPQEIIDAVTSTMTIRPLPSLAMLNHCTICDGPAEFGIYRTVEGQEVLTAVVCKEHTTQPK